jgi:hypothetical protein
MIQLVNGVTKMNYSIKPQIFVRNLVLKYAEWDELDERFALDILDLPDFEIDTLVSFLLKENDEATGCDNPQYEKKMMPALHRYLMNSHDRDAEIRFAQEWKEGIVSYFEKDIQTMIDEACDQRLAEQLIDSGCYRTRDRISGVTRTERL